jgi:hypothetical protein
MVEIEFQQTGGHARMKDTKKGIAEQSEMGKWIPDARQ